jgi:ankyrin repeat protein
LLSVGSLFFAFSKKKKSALRLGPSPEHDASSAATSSPSASFAGSPPLHPNPTAVISDARRTLSRYSGACASKDFLTLTLLLCEAITNTRFLTFVISNSIINEQDRQGRTPLLWASLLHRPELARLLLEAGSDANVADFDLQHPLHLACVLGPGSQEKDGVNLAQMLIGHGAEVDAVDKEVRLF